MSMLPQAIQLPQEICCSLTKTELLLYELLISIMKSTSRRIPSKAFYACPSQRWLAKRLNRSREWVSTSVRKLHRMGLIDVTHRRKVLGYWQTNLYRVGAALKKGWKSLKSAFLLSLVRVNKTSHIVHEKQISRKEIRTLRDLSHDPPDESFEQLMTRCLKRIESF